MSTKNEADLDYPIWLNEKGKLLETPFCDEFLREHPMRCIGRHFYTVDGMVADEERLRKRIYDKISPWMESNVAKRVDSLLGALRIAAYSDPLELECDRIHVANGTCFLDGRFSEEKAYCNNRLAVAYRPDAPLPGRWLHFLSELLFPEDVPTLQEYMGYCLLPTTRGQKMLMLNGAPTNIEDFVGRGGARERTQFSALPHAGPETELSGLCDDDAVRARAGSGGCARPSSGKT